MANAEGVGVWRRIVTGILAICIGTALLLLGAPRFVSELILAPANQYLAAVQAGGSGVSAENLRILISSRKKAVLWYPSGQTYLELALAEIQLAAFDHDHADSYLIAAREHLESGLRKNPADPYAWTQFATLIALSRTSAPAVERERINGALILSLNIAPYEPKLLVPRISVALALWSTLEPEIRKEVISQIQVAWRTPPHRQPGWREERERRHAELTKTATDLGEVSVLESALVEQANSAEAGGAENQQQEK